MLDFKSNPGISSGLSILLANPPGEFTEIKATAKTKYEGMILEPFVWKIRVLKRHRKNLLTRQFQHKKQNKGFICVCCRVSKLADLYYY